MKGERINGGAFEGLCHIINYDGMNMGDDISNPLVPIETTSAENVAGWFSKYHAFKFNEDGTMDLCIYHSTEYSTSLGQTAFNIFMESQTARMMPKGKWIEYPGFRLITVNSPLRNHHYMIAELLRFNGIDISQFAEIEYPKNQIL